MRSPARRWRRAPDASVPAVLAPPPPRCWGPCSRTGVQLSAPHPGRLLLRLLQLEPKLATTPTRSRVGSRKGGGRMERGRPGHLGTVWASALGTDPPASPPSVPRAARPRAVPRSLEKQGDSGARHQRPRLPQPATPGSRKGGARPQEQSLASADPKGLGGPGLGGGRGGAPRAARMHVGLGGGPGTASLAPGSAPAPTLLLPENFWD